MTDEENLSTLKAELKKEENERSANPNFSYDGFNGKANAYDKLCKGFICRYTHNQMVDYAKQIAESAKEKAEQSNNGTKNYYNGKAEMAGFFIENAEKPYDNGVKLIMNEKPEEKPNKEEKPIDMPKPENRRNIGHDTKKKYYEVRANNETIGFYTIKDIFDRLEKKPNFGTFKVKRYEEKETDITLNDGRNAKIIWASSCCKDDIPANFKEVPTMEGKEENKDVPSLKGFWFIDEKKATHKPEAHFPLYALNSKQPLKWVTFREFFELLGSQKCGKLSWNSLKGYRLNKKKFYVTNGKATYYLDFGASKEY